MIAVEVSAPTEIVSQVAGCHAIETAHPGFQSAAIGIDVLNVIALGDHPNAGGQSDRTMGDANCSGNANPRPAATWQCLCKAHLCA